MVIDDVLKSMKYLSCPASDDEASERVSEMGAISLQGLIGCVFKDIEQIKRVFLQLQYWTEIKVIMNSSGKKINPLVTQIITYRLELKNKDGTIYEMIVNETPSDYTIINCKISKTGTTRTQEDWNIIKEIEE